jgi:hypothetical protein
VPHVDNRPVYFIDTNTRTRLADGPAGLYRALAVHSGRGVACLWTEDKNLKVLDLGTRALTATLQLESNHVLPRHPGAGEARAAGRRDSGDNGDRVVPVGGRSGRMNQCRRSAP